MNIPAVTPSEIRKMLLLREEIALLDLRHEAAYATGHPLFAANMAAGRIELEAEARLPRKDVPIMLTDAGEAIVAEAADRFAALGYTNIRQLEGGLEGWRRAGFEIFIDVNSYAKAFGELVEHRRHTPSLAADEVADLIERNADIRILDVRRFDEYTTMNIPGSISVPGAELVLRAGRAAPNPDTTIIVNCAGRTRSLIGAQSLINAGLPNPVFALRNGTIGWTLAEQALDHGQDRRAEVPQAAQEAEARAKAREVAYRAGVKRLTLAELAALAADAARTLYRFDVRQPDAFDRGHLPGFLNAPGGQLVQETDHTAPVRGARIVLADPKGVRADMTASWLAQMGWEVYALDAPEQAFKEVGPAVRRQPEPPPAAFVSVAELAALLDQDAVTVIDLGSSRAYRQGHLPGAWFAIRARLANDLAKAPAGRPLVLTSTDGVLARFAAPEIERLMGTAPRILEGGTQAWVAAGRSLKPGLEHALSLIEDVYRRPYEGTDNAPAAMQAYLDWEFGLVNQLARDGSHGFYVI